MLRIDTTSLIIFIATFVIAQIRTIPLAIRYGALAVGCAAIALLRLKDGPQGVNLVIALAAVALAIYYLVKAIRVPRR